MRFHWMLLIFDLFNISNCQSCGLVYNFNKTFSCHWMNKTKDLPIADTISFPKKSIFFIETSCKGGLSLRQACSVESAARAHPQRQVNVLFAGPVEGICLLSEHFGTLLSYANVKLYRIHITEYSKNTPMEKWVSEKWTELIHRSISPVYHTSHMLRYLTLYKFGGTYLDLDVIVARSFDTLPSPTNWVGRESDIEMGAALISVSKHGIGKRFSSEMLSHLKFAFDPRCWACNSNGVLMDVFKQICTTTDIFKISATTCYGFQFYPPSYFYPIEFWNWKDYCKPQPLEIFKNPYAYHTWSSFDFKKRVIKKGSLYRNLAELYCPRISKLAERFRF